MDKLLWTQRSNFGPSPREGSAIAFDSNRSRTVLFGGGGAKAYDFLGDTWEWDGSFWTQMDDIGPTPRVDSAMVYDSARQVSLLFGGQNAQGLGDTWQWDGADWTRLSESGPGARGGHAMAFDSARNRTVLFGGELAGTTRANDTWEFDGVEWTQHENAGPSPRSGHSMAYDAAGGRVLLFGGVTVQGNDPLPIGDTWAWDGNEWVQIAEFGPSPRQGAAMASTGSSLILFGGVASPSIFNSPEADTWEFDGKHWTQRQDIGPGPLQAAAMAYDTARSRAVLFGGVAGANGTPFSGFTWETFVKPRALVSVSSLSLPGQVFGELPTTLTITLSGPAQESLIVTFTGPIFTPEGANLPPLKIPAGLTSMNVQVAFGKQTQPTTVTITARIAGTEPVSLPVPVAV